MSTGTNRTYADSPQKTRTPNTASVRFLMHRLEPAELPRPSQIAKSKAIVSFQIGAYSFVNRSRLRQTQNPSNKIVRQEMDAISSYKQVNTCLTANAMDVHLLLMVKVLFMVCVDTFLQQVVPHNTYRA